MGPDWVIAPFFPAFAVITYSVIILVVLGSGVFVLVALWRLMRAHESIAESTRFIAEEFARRGDTALRPSAGKPDHG